MLVADKIYQGNCLDLFKDIDSSSIDLVVTSPPYNVGIQYDNWNDTLQWNAYLEWCQKWISEIYRVLKPDGRFAINHLFECKVDNIKYSPVVEFYKMLTSAGLSINSLPIWLDTNKTKLTAWGSWQSASCPYMYNPTEVIIVGYKDQWKKLNKGIDTISKEDFIEAVGGVWKLRPETRGLTKANFPVELPKRCIELLTFKGDVVLDPFMGSGTTAIAAIQTGRRFIGFEISETYFKIANNRIAEELYDIRDFFTI